jgi:hypothetical protein
VRRTAAARGGVRSSVRLLLAGVATGTVVLAGAPAALAFALTGNPNPMAWRWDDVTTRLSSCTSRGGVGAVLNCRPAEAVDLPVAAIEEHRKGRRIFVFVPVEAQATPAPTHSSPPKSSSRRKHVVSTPTPRAVQASPVAAPLPKTSPTASPSPREDDDGHAHD